MPFILHPTYITDNSSTLIDNIFFSYVTDCNILCDNLLSMISDHLPLFAVLKDNAADYKNTYFANDYRKFDEASFLSEYSEVDISHLDDASTDLNTKFGTFLFNLNNLIEKHCPEKS